MPPQARYDRRHIDVSQDRASVRADAAAATELHSCQVCSRLWQRHQRYAAQEGLPLKNVGWQSVSLDIDKNACRAMASASSRTRSSSFLACRSRRRRSLPLRSRRRPARLARDDVYGVAARPKPGPPVAIMVHANITLPELKINRGVDRLWQRPRVELHDAYRPHAQPEGGARRVVCQATARAARRIIRTLSARRTKALSARTGAVLCRDHLHAWYGEGLRDAARLQAPSPDRSRRPVNVTGHGKESRCVLEPDAVELPPVMPHSARLVGRFRAEE